MKKTVKARVHHGADSLDLTIPAEFVRKYDIKEGDIFEVKISKKDNDTILSYKRVYESE